MQKIDSLSGRVILVLCNVAGMVDLVALPLWVGSLMQDRGLAAPQAGMLVTIYILGLFFSSIFFAPRFTRIDTRKTAAIGFLVAAAAFFGLTQTYTLAPAAVLHAVAGLGAGAGLSVTHGTIGRSANPHRLFALGGLGTGIFAILFFATLPGAIATHGAAALFFAIGILLLAAAIAAAIRFPRLAPLGTSGGAVATKATARLGVRVFAFMGVACIATTQAMIFSFVERVGNAHGFAPQSIATMLIIGGFVNLTAPICASLLDRRVSHFAIAACVIPVHAACGALAVLSPTYLPYAVGAIAFVWLIIFGHNFMFSLIAGLDPSGRTVAATPAMLMIGSAIGPFLGGVLIATVGYGALAGAAAIIAVCGSTCFLLVWNDRRRSPIASPVTAAAALEPAP